MNYPLLLGEMIKALFYSPLPTLRIAPIVHVWAFSAFLTPAVPVFEAAASQGALAPLSRSVRSPGLRQVYSLLPGSCGRWAGPQTEREQEARPQEGLGAGRGQFKKPETKSHDETHLWGLVKRTRELSAKCLARKDRQVA